jgi:hypothetical protein
MDDVLWMKTCSSCGVGTSEAAVKCRSCGAWLVATAAPGTIPASDVPTDAPPSVAPHKPDIAASRSSDVFVPPAPASTPPLVQSPPWAMSPDADAVKITTVGTPEWWRQPSVSLIATGAGFALVLAAAFALSWMRIGNNIVHLDLSYKQMQDALTARDVFSRMALDLGPLILIADLFVVGWGLATRGRIGIEAATAPAGLACLTLYVTFQIRGYVGTVNNSDLGSIFGLHASTGWGPWVCLLGCACLVVGALTGSLSTTTPRSTTYHPAHR